MDDVSVDVSGRIEGDPSIAGFNRDRLNDALQFAMRAETSWPYKLGSGLSALEKANEPRPWNAVIGPTKDRGKPNGVIFKDGQIVAEWGDPARVDMTYSATKSYLGILAGLAVTDGLIPNVDACVADTALDRAYHTDQNETITWQHMLQQTSEWEGSLWDKPDMVDRNRQLGVGADNSQKGTMRRLQKPGTHWEYNDVRVNRLSLSLMQLFRRPLPDVLRERIMDPIGASNTWQWHHYHNAFFEIDGVPLPSVSGGAHWGGGIWINSYDHALVGQLILQRGHWNGTQLLPENWVDDMLTPCPIKPTYGYLWWLNTNGEYLSNASHGSFFAVGAGKNMVWIEPENRLVVVARWIDAEKANEFAGLIMRSLI